MRSQRSRPWKVCLVVAALAAAAPHPGAGSYGHHEVGHWLGMYHTLDGLVVVIRATKSEAKWDKWYGGFVVNGRNGQVMELTCLEVIDARAGESIAYATVSPVGAQPQESDLNFIKVLVKDGVATSADFGYSQSRTSSDRCGAGLVRTSMIGAVVAKQVVVPPVGPYTQLLGA